MSERIRNTLACALALLVNAINFYVLLGSFLAILCFFWFLINEKGFVESEYHALPIFVGIALLSTFPVTRQITHLFPPGPNGNIPKWLLIVCIGLFTLEIIRLLFGEYNESGSTFFRDMISANVDDPEEFTEFVAWNIWNPWINAVQIITNDPYYPEELFNLVQQSFLIPLQILFFPMLFIRYKWFQYGIRKPNWIFLRSFHGKSDPQLLHILAKSIPRGTNLVYLAPNMGMRDVLSQFSLRAISSSIGSRVIPISTLSLPWEEVVKKLLNNNAVPIIDMSHIGSNGLKHEVKIVGNDAKDQPALWLVDRKHLVPAFKLIELSEIQEKKFKYSLCYQDTMAGRLSGIVLQFVWIGVVFVILDFATEGSISDFAHTALLIFAASFMTIFLAVNILTPATNFTFRRKMRNLLKSILETLR